MKNIVITIATESNKTIASGYDPSFYETEESQFEDVINDLTALKTNLEGESLIIFVVTWANGDKTDSESSTYVDLDNLIEVYRLKIKAIKASRKTNKEK